MSLPVLIKLRRQTRVLEIGFEDGLTGILPCEYLRVNSPSAEVQGHGPGQAILQTGKERVTINAIEPVGNYGVRLVFDDGHDSGIYTWAYLYKLVRDHDENWAAYLQALENAGHRRDPDAAG